MPGSYAKTVLVLRTTGRLCETGWTKTAAMAMMWKVPPTRPSISLPAVLTHPNPKREAFKPCEPLRA